MRVEQLPRLVIITYPEVCNGETFDADYEQACDACRQQPLPFALLHDLRAVSFVEVDRKALMKSANDVANLGQVARVAFVLASSPFWTNVISGLVSTFSPVKPACVFADVAAARAWCET